MELPLVIYLLDLSCPLKKINYNIFLIFLKYNISLCMSSGSMRNTKQWKIPQIIIPNVNHDIWIILLLVSCDACFVFNPLHPKSALTDFTLSNARRFYLSIRDPLGLKGLNDTKKVDTWYCHFLL